MQSSSSRKGRKLAYSILVVALGLVACIILYNRQAPPSSFLFGYASSCGHLVNSGHWTKNPNSSTCSTSSPDTAACGAENVKWEWDRKGVAQCGHHRRSAAEIQALLQGQWIALIGDSITRNIYAAILRLMSKDGKQHVVTGHRNFEHQLPGDIRLSFYWAPYAANATELFQQWEELGTSPEAILLSLGLWHLLHITSPSDFGAALRNLSRPSQRLHQMGGLKSLTTLSITNVVPTRLKTEDKRRTMTSANVDAYNSALSDSLLSPRGDFDLVDIHSISKGCGVDCTADGIHYSNATYDTVLQIWVNILAYQWP